MKVLFAVSNDGVTSSVAQKYQEKYKDIITKKSVYYFNAIIKELQKDRTYDALVIGEDLEPLANNDYAQADKFIFEKLDEISDEASKNSGEDIPIIFICADRRTREDALLIKLFGIGVYNALVENDRSIEKVCELIYKPRSKKEAKSYYRLEGGDVSYSPATDSEIDEVQVQNILNYFAKVGNNEQKIVQTFDHIADQYTDTQLRLIVNVLPLPVKATLESSSPRYQKLMNGGTVLSNGEYKEYSKNNPKKPTPLDAVTVIDITDSRVNKRKDAAQVVIPSSMNFDENSGFDEDPLAAYNNQRMSNNMNENDNMNINNGGVVTPTGYPNPYQSPYSNPYGGPMPNQMPMGGQMPYGQMPMGGAMQNQMPNSMPNQMPNSMPNPMPNQMPMGGQMPYGQMPMGSPMPNQMPMGNPMGGQPPMSNGQMPGVQPIAPQPMNIPPVEPQNSNTNVDQNTNGGMVNPQRGMPGTMPGQVPFGTPVPMPGTNPIEPTPMNVPPMNVPPMQAPAPEPVPAPEPIPAPDPIPMPTEPEPPQMPMTDMNTNVASSTSLGIDEAPVATPTSDFGSAPSMDEVPQTDMQTLSKEGSSPYVSDMNNGDAFVSDTMPQATSTNSDTTVNFDSLNASDSEGPLPGFEAVSEDEKKDEEGALPGFEEVNSNDLFTEAAQEPQVEMPQEPAPQVETPVTSNMDMQQPIAEPTSQVAQNPYQMPQNNMVPPPPPPPQMPPVPNTAYDPNYMPNSDYGQASTYNSQPPVQNSFGQQPMMPNMMPNPNGGVPQGNGDETTSEGGSADDGSGVLSNQ